MPSPEVNITEFFKSQLNHICTETKVNCHIPYSEREYIDLMIIIDGNQLYVKHFNIISQAKACDF